MKTVTNPEREPEPRPLTRESLQETGEGVLQDEVIDEVLAGTWWEHRRRHTSVGTAHVLTRPVTLLESVRIDPEAYQNHRHTFGITQPNGERSLTYVVLRNVHSSDLLRLPEIESTLQGAGRIRREDFSEAELELTDRIWLPTPEIGQALGMSRGAVRSSVTSLLRRWRLTNRTELLVLGLKEGFLNPDLETWRGSWSRLSPLESKVIRRMHFETPDLADESKTTIRSVHSAISSCFKKTGLRTRGEMVLAALANGECRLDELRTPPMEVRLNDLAQEMLRLVDQSFNSIVEQTGARKTTISNRYQRICETLGLGSLEELAVYAFREGYLDNQVDARLADVFSERQRQVTEQATRTNRQIAENLGIGEGVIKHHIARAKRKAGVDSRPGLVVYGLRAGLIDPEQPKPRA